MNTIKRNVLKKTKFYSLIILLICFSSCHNTKSSQPSATKTIDSIIVQVDDSLYTNHTFVTKQLKVASSLVKDSIQSYKVQLAYVRHYITVNSFDTAAMIDKKVLQSIALLKPTPEIHHLLAQANNSMGNYYTQLFKLDSAILYYNKTLTEMYLGGDKQQLTDVCINLADMYTRKGNYIEGISFFRRALLIADSIKMPEEKRFPIYFGLGQAYYAGLRNFELSDQYFRKAEKFFEGRSLNEKFVFCNNRGNFYYYKEEYAKALPWFQRARSLVLPGKYEYYIYLCEGNMGDIYFHLNKLDSATHYLDNSYHYFAKLDNQNILYYLASIKAGVALKLGDTNTAHYWLEKHKNIGFVEPDILMIRNRFLQDYFAQTENFKMAYHYQSTNNKLNDSLRTERINNQIEELDIRFKQDTARIRQNLTISEQGNQISSLQIDKYLWMILFFAFLTISIFIFLFIKKKRDLQRIQLADTNSKLRLQNIRNRISPHFIFNILNKEISSEEDKEKHQEMIGLVTFLRRSLEITEQTTVSLADEIDFIKNYLQMEQRSMGNDFRVSWDIDDKIETENWMIPAMIMQIPIENALKHALRTKIGEKRLQIFTHLKSGCLHIQIMDNGAGYRPENMVSTKGTGTGLKVMYQTIQLLNKKNIQKIHFSIKDRTQETTSGTIVEIIIPKEYRYDI